MRTVSSGLNRLVVHQRRQGHFSPAARAGFTLIELPIVVTIIGIMAAIAIPMLMDSQRRAEYARATPLAHADLVSFATSSIPCHPLPLSPRREGAPQRGERCPLCGFPTQSFEPYPAQLPPEVQDEIRADFPAWNPSRGLCQQCSDLYRSRILSPITAS